MYHCRWGVGRGEGMGPLTDICNTIGGGVGGTGPLTDICNTIDGRDR